MIYVLPPGKHKQEYPPLLAQGFHHLSVSELRTLCVNGFPDSTNRSEIMAGFEVIYERALSVQIRGEAWVDGSFLTRKIDPGDIDFIFLIDAAFYDNGTLEQYEFIDWLISNEDDPKKAFFCHTDVVLVYPKDSAEHHLSEAQMRHWEERVYGYSVATHEPKGIVVVKLDAAKDDTGETGQEGGSE